MRARDPAMMHGAMAHGVMARLLVCLAGFAALAAPVTLPAVAAAVPARGGFEADPYTSLGAGLRDHDSTRVEVRGFMRTRFAAMHNLDLDRGPTPAGPALFAVPAGDPSGQHIGRADLRLRTDLSLYAPRGGVVVRVRADVLDNLELGSAALGSPTASTSQDTGRAAIALRRAYAEVALPFGVLAAGRMGNWWGLGMLGNGGECLDCDTADAADRVILASPLFGHVLALAYDFGATGGSTPSPGAVGAVDADPGDDVRGVTIALLRYASRHTRDRRLRAGRPTLDYGAYVARRWQDRDNPADWLPTGGSGSTGNHASSSATIMARGFSAMAFDAWIRAVGPGWHAELELAALTARYEQPSLVPGVLFREPLESLQLGGAFKGRIGGDEGLYGGLDLGFASGDPSPGMGYHQPLTTGPAAVGDMHGAQADLPRDRRIDNLRMHADFRVDRILFRELVGGVTDAMYARPVIGWRTAGFGAGSLVSELAIVASRAVQAASTPGGAANLGIELDPTLTYTSRDGFRLQLQYALLLPGDGLSNPALGLSARPAQLLRLHLAWMFG